MSDAHVLDIAVLDGVRTSLVRFGADVEGAMVGALTAANSVMKEVAAKEDQVRGDVKRCADRAAGLELAYRQCRRQEDADCLELEIALGKARSELDRRLAVLREVQVTRRRVAESIDEFSRSTQRMRSTLSEHLSAASSKLGQWASVLVSYATGSVESGPIVSDGASMVHSTGSVVAGVLGSPSRIGDPVVGAFWAMVDASVALLTVNGDVEISDALFGATDASSFRGPSKAMVHNAGDGTVSLHERRAGGGWSTTFGPLGCAVLPEHSVVLFEPDSVAAQVEEVPLIDVQPGGEASPGGGSAGASAIADDPNRWRTWQRIAPAVRFGVGREFFRLLDAAGGHPESPYMSAYDAFYGEEAIEVRRTAAGTYVVVKGHRQVATARWLGIDAIPVVVVPGNER